MILDCEPSEWKLHFFAPDGYSRAPLRTPQAGIVTLWNLEWRASLSRSSHLQRICFYQEADPRTPTQWWFAKSKRSINEFRTKCIFDWRLESPSKSLAWGGGLKSARETMRDVTVSKTRRMARTSKIIANSASLAKLALSHNSFSFPDNNACADKHESVTLLNPINSKDHGRGVLKVYRYSRLKSTTDHVYVNA